MYIFSINYYINKQFLYYDFIYKLELSKCHKHPNCIYNEILLTNKNYVGYKQSCKIANSYDSNNPIFWKKNTFSLKYD